MDPKAFDRRWNELAEAVMTGMKEWRLQHPRATFRQIEAALDERLARMRARTPAPPPGACVAGPGPGQHRRRLGAGARA